MEGGGGIIHPAAGGQQEDRISNLPDEIIHEIFADLRSTKQPAQLTILSKRWSHLWRSYPVFDFSRREWPTETSKENLKNFLTAARTKFSYLRHATAIRIELFEPFKSDLLDEILSFVSTVTQEFRLDSTYCGCIVLPRGLFNDDRFRSLKVVNLKSVCFPSGSPVRFRSSLQVLSLEDILFPYKNNEGDRILNSMIEDASHLETLTLSSIHHVKSLQIQDHPKLKILKTSTFTCRNFKISGVESLRILHVFWRSEKRFQVSLAPNNNVKVLDITGAGLMKSNEELNKFISKFPRLESLKLIGFPSASQGVKINVNNHKSRRLTYCFAEKKNQLPLANQI